MLVRRSSKILVALGVTFIAPISFSGRNLPWAARSAAVTFPRCLPCERTHDPDSGRVQGGVMEARITLKFQENTPSGRTDFFDT
jgi:hypothetical protein